MVNYFTKKNAATFFLLMLFIGSFLVNANGQVTPAITYTEGTVMAPTVSNSDLLQSAATLSASSGTFDNEGSGGLSVLTNGNATNGIANRAGISSGSSITYTLNTTVNTAGYNISEINIFSAWGDNGRLTPNVTVLYAFASDPGTFISLGTTTFTPTVVFPDTWTKSIFKMSGSETLSGVVAVKFEFGTQQNGFVGYTELDVFGSPTGGQVTPVITYLEGTVTAPTVSNSDLLQSAATLSASSGTFNNEGSGGLSVLTNGNATNGIANRAGISSGSSITYTLNTTVNTAGYNISEINIFSAWGDNGRLTPNVTVFYAFASDPGTFISLGTTSFTPTVVFPDTWTKSIFKMSGGATLNGVVAVKFDFGAQQNGFVGYTELDVMGTPSGSGGADTTPPSVPANLVANNIASNAITLSWDASTDNFGVTGYNVYEGVTLVGSPTTNTYTVTNLSPLTSYSFTVVAKDGAGNVSGASSPLVVSTIAAPVFSIVYSEGNITSPSVLNDDLLQTSATLAASSGNFTNEGSAGLATLINGNAASGIANRAAISNNSSITYALNTSVNTAGYDIRGINIYSGWGDNGRLIPNVKVLYSLVADPATFITLGTATFNPAVGSPNPWTKSSFTANGAIIASGVAALKFDFGLQQNDYVGYSEIDVIGNPNGPDNIVPSIPTGLSSDSITPSSVVLSWTASTDNFGIAGYEIYEGSNLLAFTANNTYKVTGLTPGTSYSFTVRAKDVSDLFSAASTPLSVTTSAPDITPPSIPSGLVISAIAPSSFKLNWQASTDNFVVSRYILYLGADSVATVSGLTYTYTGLTASTLYTVRVVAVDYSGNKSAPSATASATTLAFKLEGYTENFNDGNINGWNGGSYGLSNEGNALKVVANKGGDAWSAFSHTFNMVDISVYPYITFKAKTKFDVNLTVAIGNIPGVLDAYPVRLETIDIFNSQEILTGNSEWQEYTFDFTGVTSADLSKVDYMQFLVNPLGIINTLPDSNIFYIEDLRIGKDAKSMAAVTSIRDISFKAGTVVPKTIPFYGLTDGSDGTHALTITATSSNTAVVPDPVVSYTNPAKLGSLTVAPNNGVAGEAVITLRVSAAGVTDKLSTFRVNVMPNQAPVMKPIVNLVANIGQPINIPLSGILDGDGDDEQTISITAASSNTSILPAANININHAATASTGLLTVSSAPSISSGSLVQVTIKLKDNGGIDLNGVDSNQYTFNITFYDKVNKAPVITPMGTVRVNALPQPKSILLSGIGDGDDGTQTITVSVVALGNTVGTGYAVGAIANDTASLNFNLTGNIGTDTVVVRLTDNGGAGNNGPLFVEDTIIIIGNEAPQTWYVNNFDNAGSINGWNGDGSAHTLTVVNSQLHVKTDIKSLSYPGIMVDLFPLTGGKYVDMSAKKYISFNLKAATTNSNKPGTISIVLLDDDALADGYYTRTLFKQNVPADGQFHKYVFDYSNLFYTQNNLTLDSTHIKGLLINIDNDWFNAYTGDYYFDDFKMGDSAEVNIVPRNTINDVSDKTYTKGQVPAAVRLTGISDGKGNATTNLSVSANNSVVQNLSVTTAVNGMADLTFTLNTQVTDSSKIRIIADDLSSTIDIPDTIYLNVYVVDTANAAIVEVRVNLNQKYQTMIGMGSVGASNSPNGFATTTDQNFTLMRIFGDFDEMENQNDNGDPYSINMANLTIDQQKMDYYRKIKETTTCKEFFYTVLSPAAWLKLNKSRHPDATTTWANNNRLHPALYDEYAEFLVIIIKAFKEKAGIDLNAISIQNEPQFNQPYPSCQISGPEFVEIMKAVGDRFAAEGITTRLIMPEDVGLSWTQEKVNPVIADPNSRKYLDIIAVHNYGENGITAGGGSQSAWTDTYNWFATTPAKDLWMTETSGFSNKWEGEMIENYLNPGQYEYAPGPFGFGGFMFSALKKGRISAWVDLDPKENSEPLRAAFKQYTKFIEPGSVVVDAQSFSNSILSIAFRNPLDSSISIVLSNTSYLPQRIQITGQGVPLAYSSVYTANNAYFQDGVGTQNGFYLMAPRSIVTLKSISSTLPVSLVDLRATRKKNVVELTWKTRNEINNKGFYIERSANGIQFAQSLGFTETKALNGNSNGLLQYSFDDAAPLNGVNYYRLKQMDKDGKFAYSNTVVVNFTGESISKVSNISPNPVAAGGTINVMVNSDKLDKATILIIDVSGRVLAERMVMVKQGSNSFSINTNTLSAGLYYFTFKSNKFYENATQPFIVR